MVNTVGITLLVLMAMGGADDAPLPPVRLWAVEAYREGHDPKQFDAGAGEVRDALEDLPFDRFITVTRQRLQLRTDGETRIPLKNGYSLFLQCQGRDADGRVRVSARVEMAFKDPDKPPCNVVETKLLLSRQGKARVGGLRTEQGELVLVMSL